MHGNLDPPNLNRDANPRGLALWLGTPAAQTYFDFAALSDADRARLAGHRNSRRQQEFKVSRALRAFAGAGAVASLSHSGGHAALLTAASEMQIGVDLEVARPRDVLRTARFAFDREEVDALEALSGVARDDLFYALWTMKEALAKALRLELVDALRQCVFIPGIAGWSGSAPTPSPWSVQVFQPRPSFFLAAACIGTNLRQAPQLWEWPPQQAASWPTTAFVAASGASSR